MVLGRVVQAGEQVIPKAERDADAAILAAATGGTWITAAPRSQEGGVQLAGFGPALAKGWPTATSLRVGGADSSTAEKAALVAVEASRMTMEQHAADAKAAAHSVNRLPVYIEAAAEMERRIDLLDAEIARVRGVPKTEENAMTWTAYLTGLCAARRILRGGK